MTSTPKRPRDPNQLAKFVIDAATAEVIAESDAPMAAGVSPRLWEVSDIVALIQAEEAKAIPTKH